MGTNEITSVDVVIVTYKPSNWVKVLIDRLCRQSVKVSNIFVLNMVDSDKNKECDILNFSYEYGKIYFNGVVTDDEDIIHFDERFGDSVKVNYITKGELQENGSINSVKSLSNADYILYIAQDVLPVDKYLVENMLKVLEKDSVGATYARQLPNKDSGYIEKLAYKDKFSKNGFDKVRETAFFGTGDCVMYKADVFKSLSGESFICEAYFNKKEIEKKGFRTVSVIHARVRKCDNRSLRYVFSKSFEFARKCEKVELLSKDFYKIMKTNSGILVIKYIFFRGAEVLGNFIGKTYKIMPKKLKKLVIYKFYACK